MLFFKPANLNSSCLVELPLVSTPKILHSQHDNSPVNDFTHVLYKSDSLYLFTPLHNATKFPFPTHNDIV